MFKRVIITSGPTIEPIDPVRFISNRSSGKSGYQLAAEAVKRGIAEIIFITGPTCYLPPDVTVIPVETALEMRSKLQQYSDGAEVIIMAAAVCDYRVAEYSPQKIKKDRETITLPLVKNPDLLWELGQRKKKNQVLVGYAAETRDITNTFQKRAKKTSFCSNPNGLTDSEAPSLMGWGRRPLFENARAKFEKKNLDLLVLNEVSEENPAFNVEENQVYFFTAGGIQKLEKMEKSVLAVRVWDEVYKIAKS